MFVARMCYLSAESDVKWLGEEKAARNEGKKDEKARGRLNVCAGLFVVDRCCDAGGVRKPPTFGLFGTNGAKNATFRSFQAFLASPCFQKREKLNVTAALKEKLPRGAPIINISKLVLLTRYTYS